MTPQPNYFAVIPASVRYDDRISPNGKLLYGELTALTSAVGYCWATNDYLANLYKVTVRTLQRWLDDLAGTGYIRIEYSDDLQHRHIYITDPAMSSNVTRTNPGVSSNVTRDKSETRNNSEFTRFAEADMSSDVTRDKRQMSPVTKMSEGTGDIFVTRSNTKNKNNNTSNLRLDNTLTRTREGGSEEPSQMGEPGSSLANDDLPLAGSEGDRAALSDFPAGAGKTIHPAPKPLPRGNPVAQGGLPAQGDNPWDPLLHPPTLQQVIEAGQSDGVPPDQCERFLTNYTSVGWAIREGVYIRNWRQRLALWRSGNEPEFARRKQSYAGEPPRPAPAKPAQPAEREYSFHEREEMEWREKIRASGGYAYGLNGEKFKLVGEELIPV